MALLAIGVTGYVVDANGAPVRGANIQAEQIGVSAGAVASSGWAQSDNEGRFKVTSLADGDYRIVARGNNVAPAIRSPIQAGAADVKFVLTPGGTIAGNIVDGSGTAIANARLNLVSDDGVMITSARSGADGAFKFQFVPEGAKCRIMGWIVVNGQRSEIQQEGSYEAGQEGVKIEVK